MAKWTVILSITVNNRAWATMNWPLRNRCWSTRTHRVSVGLALGAYLVAAIGFPLPPPDTNDHSQRYPCQDHQCGCLKADECWEHCCCYTPEEKLAWARTHEVVPPAFAELRTDQPSKTVQEDASEPVACAAFSPHKERPFLVVGTTGGGVHVWTPAERGEQLKGRITNIDASDPRYVTVRVEMTNPGLLDRSAATVIVNPGQ